MRENLKSGLMQGELDSGKTVIGLNGSGFNRVLWSAPNSLAKDVWTHVAGTYDGKVLRLFVSGEQVAEHDYLTSLDAAQGPTSLLIGREFKTGLYDRSFVGALHDVRLWNTESFRECHIFEYE